MPTKDKLDPDLEGVAWKIAQARAAWWLLDSIYRGGELSMMVDGRPSRRKDGKWVNVAPTEEEKDRLHCLTKMALDALDEATTEAAREVRALKASPAKAVA